MPARIEYEKGYLFPNTRLTYQHDLPNKGNRRQAEFTCECGQTVQTDLNWVRFLNVTSCGCYRSEVTTEKNTKHSHASRDEKSGVYRSWQSMHQRVKVNPNYSHVVVCKRWSGDQGFINFLEDMGERPEGHTLERRENSKGYSPSNCVWATHLEQAQNMSQTVHITINNETHSINEWCRINSISYGVVKQRRKRGMSIEDAITTPLNQSKRGRKNG